MILLIRLGSEFTRIIWNPTSDSVSSTDVPGFRASSTSPNEVGFSGTTAWAESSFPLSKSA